MAKRAPMGEEPYRPLLDRDVISAALVRAAAPATVLAQAHSRTEQQSKSSGTNVVEFTRAELPKSQELSISPVSEQQMQQAEPEIKVTQLTAQDLVEKFDQEKRMLLTRNEAAALERLVSSLASRLNTNVKLSHVLRSLVMLILNAEREVDKRAGDSRGITRPANGDANALRYFEKEIGRIFAGAIRDAGPVK